MRQNINSISGVTITEVMAVVVIIGILVVMAWNAYKPSIARARQAEAKLNLKAIADLEELWFLEHGVYLALAPIGGAGASGACAATRKKNELGFRPKDCDELRYRYETEGVSNATAKAWSDGSKTSTRIYPGCTTNDWWTVTHKTGKLKPHATHNVLKGCD